MAEDIALLPFFVIMILVVINVESKLPDRKSTRLKNYDYGKTGVYFVTICTEGRKRILSEIVRENNPSVGERTSYDSVGEGLAPPENKQINLNSNFEGQTAFANNYKPKLTPIGEIAKEQIWDLEKRYNNVKIKSYVIMPDHIHILISLRMEAGGVSPSPTIYDVVCAFKSLTSRECKKTLGIEKMFQRSFFDHVIRDREDYEIKRDYIRDNPIKWYYDHLNE